MQLKYYQPQFDGNIVYSVDMLRLSFHVSYVLTDILLKYINSHYLDWDYEYFHSFKIGTYRHLFSFSYSTEECTNGKFTIGIGLNRSCSQGGADCFIEFNPNKNDMDYIYKVLEFLSAFTKRIDGQYFELMRYDLAVDVPCKRSEVLLVKNGKRVYTRTISDSVTEYIGKRNTNGFTKVYDKTIESNLDYDLTRIEVTCDSLQEFAFPEVYVVHDDVVDVTELNDTDVVIVSMLRQFEHDEQLSYLKKMGRRKKDKLSKYIFPQEKQFKFNMDCVVWLTLEIMSLMTLYDGYGRLEYKCDAQAEREKLRSAVIEEFQRRELSGENKKELLEEFEMLKAQWKIEDSMYNKVEYNEVKEKKENVEIFKQYNIFDK